MAATSRDGGCCHQDRACGVVDDRYVHRARRDAAGPFSLVYAEELPIPNYGGVFPNVPIVFRNLAAPVTAAQFRLEVVQNGGGMWHGPRILRVFGFGGELNRGTVAAAIEELPPDIQYVARIYLQNPRPDQ